MRTSSIAENSDVANCQRTAHWLLASAAAVHCQTYVQKGNYAAAAQADAPTTAVPWAAFYVGVFGSLYGDTNRVPPSRARARQQSIDALEANPASFVWYTSTCLQATPANPKPNAGNGDRPLAPDGRPPGTDTRQRFCPLVRRGLRRLGGSRRGRRRAPVEKALRGRSSGYGQHQHGGRRSPTDAAGGVSRRLYLDDTASVKPCPDGAFCKAGRRARALCAGMCNASRPLRVSPHHSSSLQTYDRRDVVFPHMLHPRKNLPRNPPPGRPVFDFMSRGLLLRHARRDPEVPLNPLRLGLGRAGTVPLVRQLYERHDTT